MNPFPVVGYHLPEYFCDRERETEMINQAIINNRPLSLVSIRRLGKTALLRNVFYHLDRIQYIPIYIDLEGTDSLRGFISRFSQVAGASLQDLDRGWLELFMKWAGGIGASVSLDPISGMPSLELNHQQKIGIESLDALLATLDSYPNKTFIIAFDEFQEVTKYENQNTEGWLRAIMQAYPKIRFLFSGSEKHVMTKIFNDPSRPFYQISQPMQLGYIDQIVYGNFILEKLDRWSGKVKSSDIDNILTWCRGHTYYIQYFCNFLYEKLENDTFRSVDQIKAEILESQKHFFMGQKNLLAPVQWKTLKAIAKKQVIQNVSASSFLNFSGLAPTSVRRSVEALLEKDLLLQEEDGIKVYNVFLSRFLERLE